MMNSMSFFAKTRNCAGKKQAFNSETFRPPRRKTLGSTRDSRVGFGDSPKQSFYELMSASRRHPQASRLCSPEEQDNIAKAAPLLREVGGQLNHQLFECRNTPDT
jgi:hypothetical protein